jgi:hypothetical protein
MDKYPLLRKGLAIGIILLFITIVCSPSITAKVSKPSEYVETNDDVYHFFPFAIIWGEFEILNEKNFLRGLDVYNPWPYYNETLHLIGYVGYDGVGFYYGDYSRVYCPWWVGVVGQHHLFVIGWGNSIQAC